MQKIFLPGWGIPIENYDKFIEDNKFDFVLDYGFFSDSLLTENIIELENCINKKTAIYAHSLGGLFALKLVVKYKDICELNLYSPFARFSADNNYLGQTTVDIENMAKQLQSNPKMLLKRFYRMVCAPEKNTIKASENYNIANLDLGLDFLKTLDYRADLASIKIPVKLIQGKDDKVSDISLAKYMHERLHNSQLEIIEDKGHWLF